MAITANRYADKISDENPEETVRSLAASYRSIRRATVRLQERLSEDDCAVQSMTDASPIRWHLAHTSWFTLSLGGERALRPNEPLCHISYFEADAYARWAAARLPTEAEWEVAAREVPVEGNFVERDPLHPRPAPLNTSEERPVQLFGDVWEWTASSHSPCPGYRAPDGPLAE